MTDFHSIFAHAFASGSKSTTLRPLGWLIALTISGCISASKFGAPGWFTATLGGAATIAIVFYLTAYVYFALTDKDSLRSEKYSIQKMAIEHGLIGDDLTGFFRIKDEKTVESPLPESKNQTQVE